MKQDNPNPTGAKTMTTDTKSEIVDLGCANDWDEQPDVVTECNDARWEKGEKHDFIEEEIGRCYYRRTCRTCGYTYRVDTSG